MTEHDIPDLSISDEKLCFIIANAREFDVKDVVTNPDDASNPTDDAMIAVLEDHKDDPVVQDSSPSSIPSAWTSRWIWWRSPGSAAATARFEDWTDLRAEAARAHNRRTAAYLLGIPLLADYLGEAIDQFGIECEGEE